MLKPRMKAYISGLIASQACVLGAWEEGKPG